MASKFEKDHTKDECEIQVHGFPLKQIKLEHRLMVKLELETVIEAFTNKLLKRLENEKEMANEIKKISDDMSAQIFNTLEPNFKEFDNIVDRCFKIPNTASLPENTINNEYTSETEEFLMKDVEDMTKTFMENVLMINALKAEREQFKSIAQIIEEDIKSAERLEEVFRETNSMLGTLNFDDKK